MEPSPKGSITSKGKEKLDSQIKALVGDEIEDLCNEKRLLNEKKKEVEEKLKKLKEIISENKGNYLGDIADLMEKHWAEKDGMIWNEAQKNTSRWVDWQMVLKGLEEEDKDDDVPCYRTKKDELIFLKEGYEKKLEELSREETFLKEELHRLSEEAVELGRFYEEFASKHPDNVTIAVVDDYNDDLWKEHNEKDLKLERVFAEKRSYNYKLSEVEGDIKKNEAQCPLL